MAEITFVYKGRYWLREANTIELLSAIARKAGWDTSLIFDEDLFGVSDNVFSWPALNRLIDPPSRYISAAAKASGYVVFLQGAAGPGWARQVAAGLKRAGSKARTVLLVPFGDAEESGFDHVLRGEAEPVFGFFLDAASAGAPPPGLRTGSLADLDELPPPDRSIFEKHMDFSLSCMVHASRGCRGACTYCGETAAAAALGPGYFRRRSVGGLMSELGQLKSRYAPREIIFKDAVFTDDRGWLEEFSAVYGDKIGIPYKCFSRADLFDAQAARLLKDSGCYCVEFGLQTFNDRLRKGLGRPETAAQIEAAFSACARAGLAYDADYIFGLPGETFADHKDALLRFSRLKGLNRIKCHNLVYQPGSPIAAAAPAGGDMRPGEAGRGDFFSGDRSAHGMVFYNACFRNFFKLMGLFGGAGSRVLLRSGLWRLFSLLPGPVAAVLEMAAGLARGDRRFSVYLRYYPKKVASHFRGA